jgi:hypothetical protein
LLFSGGLQNPERTHRHKNKDGKVLCLCKNGEPSLHHISWVCSRFKHIRQDVLSNLPMSVDQLPECFRSCAIVPMNFPIDDDTVILTQQVLVQIWQLHINDWYNGAENFLIIPNQITPHLPDLTDADRTLSSQSVSEPADRTVAEPLPRNGHVLKIMYGGGVFCQKCGKSTKLQKHQRLKFLSKPCVNPNLPRDKWLQAPGAINNQHRL